jgi:hypothetical protein
MNIILIPEFGPEEIITIRELKIGDFVVKVPQQANIRGLIVNSAVRTIEDRQGYFRKRTGHRTTREIVDGKTVGFEAERHRTFSWPNTFSVIVRRPQATGNKQDSTSTP